MERHATDSIGMDMLITGNIPQGAGLSSSAAFVVSVVLSFLVGADKLSGLNKGDIVKLALASEHRMGLRNGGLDVSIDITNALLTVALGISHVQSGMSDASRLSPHFVTHTRSPSLVAFHRHLRLSRHALVDWIIWVTVQFTGDGGFVRSCDLAKSLGWARWKDST